MRNTNNTLETFQKAEARALPWYQFEYGSFSAKLKRLLFVREKYFVLLLHRLGLKRHITAQLFFGKRLRLPLAEANALKMYFIGTLGSSREQPLTAFLILHLTSEDVFYDIGANFGFYSFLAEVIITNGEIHAFEPNPRIFPYLVYNTTVSTIVINQLALNSEGGRVTFFDAIDDSSGGSLIRAKDRDKEAYTEVTVSAMTLDAYTNDYKPPSVIKIDVEGAELQVLKGATETLKKYKPVVILEVWGGERGRRYHQSAIRFLYEMGYTPYHIDERGKITPLISIDFTAIRRYENFVFKKK